MAVIIIVVIVVIVVNVVVIIVINIAVVIKVIKVIKVMISSSLYKGFGERDSGGKGRKQQCLALGGCVSQVVSDDYHPHHLVIILIKIIIITIS